MYRHYTVGNIPVSEKERVKSGHIDISVEERELMNFTDTRDAGMCIDGWLLFLESSQWVLILALCI